MNIIFEEFFVIFIIFVLLYSLILLHCFLNDDFVSNLNVSNKAHDTNFKLSTSITTYNIKSNYDETYEEWNKRKTKLFNALKNLKSDIFCFQELSKNQISEFKQFLSNYDYDCFSRARDILNLDESIAICWKKHLFKILSNSYFWLSDFPDIAGSKFLTMEFNRIVLWTLLHDSISGINFIVVNVHFDDKGIYLTKESSAKLVDRKIKYLAEKYNADVVYLCGDFNIIPDKVNINLPNFNLYNKVNKIYPYINLNLFIRILNKITTTYHNFSKLSRKFLVDFIFIKLVNKNVYENENENDLKLRDKNNKNNLLKIEYKIHKNKNLKEASDHYPVSLILK